jgi:hypothetical protein
MKKNGTDNRTKIIDGSFNQPGLLSLRSEKNILKLNNLEWSGQPYACYCWNTTKYWFESASRFVGINLHIISPIFKYSRKSRMSLQTTNKTAFKMSNLVTWFHERYGNGHFDLKMFLIMFLAGDTIIPPARHVRHA